MIELEFSSREMTALEFLTLERLEKGEDVILNQLNFIQQRADNFPTDPEEITIFMTMLMKRNVSEIRRLYLQAVSAALTPTKAACDRVNNEFPHLNARDQPNQLPSADKGDYDDFFPKGGITLDHS